MASSQAVSSTSHEKTAVLIHGLSEDRSAWSRQVPFLQSSMNVIAYDVRGFGASPIGRGDGTVEQIADDLGQILSALDTGPAWLVGFSMGGVIAQRFAMDHPDRVAGLVLIASSCKVGHAGVEFFEHRIQQANEGGLERLHALNLDDARGCISAGHDGLVTEYQALRTTAVRDIDGYLNACRAMLRLREKPMIEDLGLIDCPTAVLAGELDPYCPPRAAQQIADAISGSELTVIPNTGHCLHWEQPDFTNQLIHDFIHKHD
jgi:3-oxoadipate enol-lactonase